MSDEMVPLKNEDDSHYESFVFSDDGIYPNNARLPLVVFRQAVRNGSEVKPAVIENRFRQNGWRNSWRNGLYGFHHYHSTAHEVLGVYRGWVKVRFGGAEGSIVTAWAGDVIVVPAGVSHKNMGQSRDFQTVGAYPQGQIPDMNYGNPGERPQADEQIKKVPLPACDPVWGATGFLKHVWK